MFSRIKKDLVIGDKEYPSKYVDYSGDSSKVRIGLDTFCITIRLMMSNDR